MNTASQLSKLLRNVDDIRQIAEDALKESTELLATAIPECLKDAEHLHDDMTIHLRHALAKEVLSYKQSHRGQSPDDKTKAELVTAAVWRAAETFGELFDLAVDYDRELKPVINQAVFQSFAATQTGIRDKIFSMSKSRLAFEIASTGVLALNDRIGSEYPLDEMMLAKADGLDELKKAIAEKKDVKTLKPYYWDKRYEPGVRVF